MLSYKPQSRMRTTSFWKNFKPISSLSSSSSVSGCAVVSQKVEKNSRTFSLKESTVLKMRQDEASKLNPASPTHSLFPVHLSNSPWLSIRNKAYGVPSSCCSLKGCDHIQTPVVIRSVPFSKWKNSLFEASSMVGFTPDSKHCRYFMRQLRK